MIAWISIGISLAAIVFGGASVYYARRTGQAMKRAEQARREREALRGPINGLNFEADHRLRAAAEDIAAAYPLAQEEAVERVREGIDSLWRRP